MRRAAIILLSLALSNAVAEAQEENPGRYCKPTQPCWPKENEWQALGAKLKGKLEKPQSPLKACFEAIKGRDCATALTNLQSPYYLQDQSGGTQSLGWLGAWEAAPSRYAVVARAASDIAAAVDFARQHHLRLVIKGTGHDYLGRSNAPDSLLIWTHEMRAIELHDAFVPAGCAARAGVPAVSVGAGTRWLEAYDAVTTKHQRYVQGGGCTSVGAAGGFLQGGGFGSWSKKYGIAAASLLEAEVVTADGKIVIANACQNRDLFWALRGGGGGTFGVVTRVTLMTHPLPKTFGAVAGMIEAKTDSAFAELIERFLTFYGERLNNEHWGEKVGIGKDSLELGLVFQGLSAAEAQAVWQPLREWIDARPRSYTMKAQFIELAPDKMWDYTFLARTVPGVVATNDATRPLWWWKTNEEELLMYWIAYQSRWIPGDRFTAPAAPAFARVLFAASRHAWVSLHFNKGQAGAAPEALARDRETSMNPAVFTAAALAIIATGRTVDPAHPLDRVKAVKARDEIAAAMQIIRQATPDAGSYVNETDYFEPDWKHEFWGENYPKLLAIKHKYDPSGLFFCHHCVGSDEPH
jgi:FAD/FMN-containing dehydrogenase